MKQLHSLLTLAALSQLGCDPGPEPTASDVSLEAPDGSTLRAASADPRLARVAFAADDAGGFVGADSDTVRVDADGLGVRLGKDTLRFALRSWGRAGDRREVEAADPTLGACVADAPTRDTDCARRVEQDHGALTAWVARRERGVEQGWTLAERPAGRGPVELQLAVTGGEVVEVDADAAVLATTGVRWRYTGLKAWDAAGKDLPIHLARAPRGLAIVVDDTDARYPLEIDPTLYSTEVKLTPQEAPAGSWPMERHNYGAAIRDIGDLNGDGYDDVAVGAPYDSTIDSDGNFCRAAGRVYLYFGGPLGVDPASEKIVDAHADGSYAYWTTEYPQAFPTDYCHLSRFGSDIAAADFDHDGKQDLVIGAPGHRYTSIASVSSPTYDTGHVWNYGTQGWYGGLAIPSFLTNTSSGSGTPLTDQIGTSVDAIMGQKYAMGLATGPSAIDLGGFYNETAQLFSDMGDCWAGNPCAAAGIFEYDLVTNEEPSDTYDRYGHRARLLATPGLSWAIGAPLHGDLDEGRIWVGGSDSDGNYYHTAIDNPWPNQYERFGADLDDAGDVDGDGNRDLIVAAPRAYSNGPDAGAAYLYFGSPNAPMLNADNRLDLVPFNLKPSDELGAVAGIGDLNGDGYDDLLLGAHQADVGATNTGRAYVVFGGANANFINIVSFSPSQIKANDYFGHRVSAAGDVDSDGRPDMMVSACDKYELEQCDAQYAQDGWDCSVCSGAVYIFTAP